MTMRDLSSIDASAATAYLRLHGWSRAHEGELGTRWSFRVDGETRNLAIPTADLDAHDRDLMFTAALRVLEDVERRSADAIVRDLHHADSDVVRFHLVAPELSDGEMPVVAAPELLGGALEALTYAARAEVQPRAYYAGGKTPSTVKSFLDGARVGSTEKGSVILTLRSAVDEAQLAQTSLVSEAERPPSTVPFERRALRRLLDGVRAAKTAVHRDVVDVPADEMYDDDIEAGLSANLCDALTHLGGHESEIGAEVEISVRWSLFVPSDEPESSVSVTSGEITNLGVVAERLRSFAAMENRTVRGFVKALQRPPGDADGVAQLLADVDGKTLTVRVRLAAADYHLALQAHDVNQEMEVIGTLEKAGKVWAMVAPTSVAVIE